MKIAIDNQGHEGHAGTAAITWAISPMIAQTTLVSFRQLVVLRQYRQRRGQRYTVVLRKL